MLQHLAAADGVALELSEAELDRLRRFPDAIGADELIRFFTLMPGDVAFVNGHRGEPNWIGIAVQLWTLPWLCGQLSVAGASLREYGMREQARTDHLRQVAAFHGWRVGADHELTYAEAAGRVGVATRRSIGIQDPRNRARTGSAAGGSRLAPGKVTPSEESHIDANESTQRYPTVLLPSAAVTCLLVGIASGAVSVYSDSRLACAVWVIAAMAFTSLAGLVLGSSKRWFRWDQLA